MTSGSDVRRVLVVTAAMGGGHLQVSRELARRLTDRGHQVRLADLTDLMPAPTGRWLRAIYPWLVNRAPWLYDLVYRQFFLARQHAGERAGVPVRLALPRLRRHVAGFRPDVVVSTYHLAALAVARLRARGLLDCPAVTFVTTFSVHNLWLHPATDAYLCISEQAAQEVRRRTAALAEVCGPVVRPSFAAPPGSARAEVRDELGVAAADRMALVVTGSLGLGSVARAVAAIAERAGWVPVVVCGRNEELRRELAGHPGAVTLGWVADMGRLMAAADVLVENAGGLSSKEALRAGLPVVTFRPIAGHGRDDAAALDRLRLTDLVYDEPALLAALDRLVEDAPLRRERVDGGRGLFTGDAASSVERLAAAGRGRSRSAEHHLSVARARASG